MISPALKKYLQADFRLFLLVFVAVLIVHLFLLKMGRGGRIENKEEFPAVPDIALLTLPRSSPQNAPGGVELRDPSFLFRPHAWSFTDKSAEEITLGMASVVQETGFSNGQEESGVFPQQQNFDGDTRQMAQEYMRYRVLSPQEHEMEPPDRGAVDPMIPQGIDVNFSLEKSIFKGRNWRNPPVILNQGNLAGVLNTALVKIAVTPAGRIDFVLLEKSSGSVEADKEIINALQKATLQPVDSMLNTALVWAEVEVKWIPKADSPEKNTLSP